MVDYEGPHSSVAMCLLWYCDYWMIFFFYSNGFKYKCQKFLKHIIMKTCPECKILLWQSLEQFSHLENPDLGTIYQTNSGSEVTRPSLWPVEMNTQRQSQVSVSASILLFGATLFHDLPEMNWFASTIFFTTKPYPHLFFKFQLPVYGKDWFDASKT